jgi:serine/threonine-protein kinase
VYAFGVIAYELLKGGWPFAGPDFREQHLHNKPLSLPGIPVTLDALVQECLYKAPAARPSPANLLARLGRIAELHASSRGLEDLQNANRGEVSRRGDVDRRESASQSEAERRDDLFQAAIQGLSGISDALREAIIENASTATVEQVPGGWTIRLNRAELRLTPPTKTREAQAGPWGVWKGPIDVIAHASLILTRAPDFFDDPDHYYKGRSHSLWYCNAKEEGRYQCFETAFMVSRVGADPSLHYQWAGEMDRRFNEVPFSLDPGQESIQALSADPSIFEVAWPFTVVSIGELDEFIDRWASWLANASEGRLDRPLELPERPTQGSWRQS